MFNLKISRSEIEALLPSAPADLAENIFASIAWNVISEPGDGFAGLLTSVLGPAQALEAELNNLSPNLIRQKIVERFQDSSSADSFGVFEKELLVARERWRPRLSLDSVRSAIYGINKVKGEVITRFSSAWPRQLADLGAHEPLALWLRGSRQSLKMLENSMAVVGSRGSTAYGEFATDLMVSTLVPKGFSIVSGGAYGIDAVAHRSALALQGNTVAVMAGGVDRFYPSGNSDLLKRISQTGAVISELPPGSTPTKWRFLQRNRLISALSQATLVTEANWRSGALNTVSHCERLERAIYAVPGPVTSPKSAGTNKLIADGRAQLVIDGQDLLDRMGIQQRVVTAAELAGLGAIETRVLDAIGFDTMEIAEICTEAGLTRDEARFGLGNLELDGLIVRRGMAWTKVQTNL